MNILNTANTTPGADHFGDFRCTILYLTILMCHTHWQLLICSSISHMLLLSLNNFTLSIIKLCSVISCEYLRSFKFSGREELIRGRAVMVGVLQCQVNYRSGLKSWHDTLGEEDAIIPLWKDPHLVLDYETFWSQKHLWRPYIAKAVSPEAVRNYEISLASCIPRIQLLQEERSEEIIANLQVFWVIVD